METESEHPWNGKLFYMDLGDGVDGGEVSGRVVSVRDTTVTVETLSGLEYTEDYSKAIYVEVECFGVIDI